jgi:hypothetical protein
MAFTRPNFLPGVVSSIISPRGAYGLFTLQTGVYPAFASINAVVLGTLFSRAANSARFRPDLSE